jgi:hypothetical protein
MLRDRTSAGPGRRAIGLLVLLIAASGVLAIVNLDTRVVIDDPWHSIAPYRLASLGSLSDPVTWPGEFAEHHLLTRPVYNLLLAGTFQLAGLGVEQGRLLSIVFAALTVIGAFLLAREWYDDRVAWVSALLLSANNLLFLSARTVRPETLLCAAAVFTLFFYFRGRRTGSVWAFAGAGVVSGLGALAHPNMVLVVAAVGLIELVDSGPSRFLRERGLWIYAAAVGFVCAPFVAYVVVLDGPNDFQNFATQYMLQGRSRSLSGWEGVLASLRGELGRYATYASFPYRTAQVLLEVVALGFLARRWAPADRRVWLVILTSVVLFAAIISNKSVRYLAVLVPFMSIAVAAAANEISARFPLRVPASGRFGLTAGGALVAGYFALNFVGNVGLLATTTETRYYEVFEPMREAVPADAVIYGSFVPWFLFADNEYYACGRHSVDDILDEVGPDVLLWDESGYCNKWTPADEAQRLRDEIDRRGTHLSRIEHAYYGAFDVYRLGAEPEGGAQ